MRTFVRIIINSYSFKIASKYAIIIQQIRKFVHLRDLESTKMGRITCIHEQVNSKRNEQKHCSE